MAPVILPRKLKPPRNSIRRRMLTSVVVFAAGVLILATIAGFAARLLWVCDLFSPFRVHYFWGLTFSAGTLAALRKKRLAVIPTLFALANLALIAPLYLPAEQLPAITKTAPLRVLSLNVHAQNREFRELCDFVRKKSPDVAVFYEVSEIWADQLAELGDLLPYHKVSLNSQRPIFGIAIFSRHPLWEARFEELGDGSRAVVAAMILESQPFTIFGVHPGSPLSPDRAATRDGQLARLGALAATHQGPVVLVGDLNATSWSPVFRDLVRTTGLCDSRAGFGVGASWPAGLGWLGIPIDHCLVSPEIRLRRREVGPDVGSDHRPLVVDLLFKID